MLIDDLGLSVRAYNCLRRAGARTIEEMAQVDLMSMRNCGEKTRKEILVAIAKLRENGAYSEEFKRKELEREQELRETTTNVELSKIVDYIRTLGLSARSSNVLIRMGISSPAELAMITEEKLFTVKNAGVSTVKEITNYIKANRKELGYGPMSKKMLMENMDIASYTEFNGDYMLLELPTSEGLRKELEAEGIYTINHLIFKKAEVNSIYKEEYETLYKYLYEIIFEQRKSQLSEGMREIYIKLPFSTECFEEGKEYKVKELINLLENKFEELSIQDKINLQLYMSWLESLNIQDVEAYIFSMLGLKDRELDIMLKRTYMTLEEVGAFYNITRERARQIEAKAVRNSKRNIKKVFFNVLNKEKMYYSADMTMLETIMMYFDSLTDKTYEPIKEGKEIYYIPVIYIKEVENEINFKKSELEMYGHFPFDISKAPEMMVKCIKYYGLDYYKGNVIKDMTKQEQFKCAMRYLGKPIHISNDEDKKELVNTVKELFGTEIPTNRYVEALINAVGIRVAAGTYSGFESAIELPENVLNEIKEYVKEKEIINSRDLFIKFGETLNAHNLNNEVILYRYLKEKLEGELYFHGVSAVISSNKDIGSWGEVVVRDIKSTKRPVNKSDIMIKYAMTEAVYNTLATNFSDIIVWSKKELYLRSLVQLPERLEEQIITAMYEKQILSFSEIKAIMNRYDARFLEDNNIRSNENLYYFLNELQIDNVIIDKKSNEVILQKQMLGLKIEEYEETKELTI